MQEGRRSGRTPAPLNQAINSYLVCDGTRRMLTGAL
jgi:hypothetical protein